MKRHTVKQVAKLSGVTVRTLHHYDKIGLLKPAFIGENRYRYYTDEELLRLQQILFYREFGIPLTQIGVLLDQPDFDHVATLQEHKLRLETEAKRYRQLIRTIDRTITRLKGERVMKNTDLYKGFSPHKQEEYENWLIENNGEEVRGNIEKSKKQVSAMSASEKDQNMTELAEVEQSLAEQFRQGTSSSSLTLEPLLVRHREWVATMWGRPCSPQAYAGLVDMYLSHPDFEKRYELIETGFNAFLTSAMKTYVERQPS